jgi:hypothetical protein
MLSWLIEVVRGMRVKAGFSPGLLYAEWVVLCVNFHQQHQTEFQHSPCNSERADGRSSSMPDHSHIKRSTIGGDLSGESMSWTWLGTVKARSCVSIPSSVHSFRPPSVTSSLNRALGC